jgi:hypothetical protein
MQNPEYRKVFAISQSAIKAFKTKPIQKFKRIYIDGEKDEDVDEDKYDFGSLSDTITFTPDLLNDRFYIPNEEVEIPGEKVKLIIDKVFTESTSIREEAIKLNKYGNLPEPIRVQEEGNLGEWEKLILKYAREIKYGGTTWSAERIIDNVLSDGSKYFRLLGESRGRRIITPQENMDALQITEILRTSRDTHAFFVQQEGETLLFQQEIFIDFVDKELMLPLKGAIDILRINHKDQSVTVADLKTTHNVQEFRKVATSFDYIVQVSFYCYIVEEFLKTFRGGIYKNYKMNLPINIAIDRECKIPYIYEYTERDLNIARFGSEEHNFVGWLPTLFEIAWHMKSGVWTITKEMYEKGKIILKIFK